METTTTPETTPKPEPKYQAPVPPVSLNVQWFQYGRKTAPPQAALVVNREAHGTLSLLVFDHNGGVAGRKRGVWHVSDPGLAKADHLAKTAAGTWDYVPGTPRVDLNHPLVDYEATIEALKGELQALRDAIVLLQPCADVPQSIQDRIVALFKDGKKPGEIAKILGGDWTHQKVNGVLRHLGEQ